MDEFGVRIGKYFSCHRSATETELVHKLCEERATQIVTIFSLILIFLYQALSKRLTWEKKIISNILYIMEGRVTSLTIPLTLSFWNWVASFYAVKLCMLLTSRRTVFISRSKIWYELKTIIWLKFISFMIVYCILLIILWY